MKLFCLPYAGGGSSTYYEWKKYLDNLIKLYAVELSGRGKRYDESLYDNLEEALQDIYNEIKDDLVSDYAFFGHSMGALLAYELYFKVLEHNRKGPRHIFLSGFQAPNMPSRSATTYNLPTLKFIESMRSLGGTPEEVLKNNDLLRICLPILRSDLKLVETYQYVEKSSKLDCDISVLYGTGDLITVSDLLPWKEQTNKSCKMYEYEGNHFFINDHREQIINMINHTITNISNMDW